MIAQMEVMQDFHRHQISLTSVMVVDYPTKHVQSPSVITGGMSPLEKEYMKHDVALTGPRNTYLTIQRQAAF